MLLITQVLPFGDKVSAPVTTDQTTSPVNPPFNSAVSVIEVGLFTPAKVLDVAVISTLRPALASAESNPSILLIGIGMGTRRGDVA